MRILVVTDLFPPVSFGGYELECATVVDHLRHRHEVLVLTSDRAARTVTAQAGVARVLPYSGGGRLAAPLAPIHAVRAARTARRLLAARPPDLVFVWNATAIPTVAVRIAVDHGSPVVHRLCERWFAEHLLLGDHFARHFGAPAGGLRSAWGRLVRAAARHSALRVDMLAPYPAAISWNSEALRRAVRLPGVVRPVLERVIHPATRSGEYFGTLERRPDERTTLLFVGRVGPQKGADVAVRALAALRRDHGIDARLVMAGPCDAAGRAWIRRLAAGLGVDGRLDLLGNVDTPTLGAWLQRAHVMVAPSRSEAFGLACVEAAWARVPVVASRVEGIPEALRDDEHALLVEVEDAEACAAAVARTLQDPAATRARVERALGRARELSADRYLAETDRLLEDALAASGAAA